MNRILVIGHLNVDYVIPGEWFAHGELAYKPRPSIGGTAYNAARAFKSVGIEPVIIGCLGKDVEGGLVMEALKRDRILTKLIVLGDRPTGICHIISRKKSGKNRRFFIRNQGDANTLDLHTIEKALGDEEAKNCQWCFIAGHLLERKHEAEATEIIQAIGRKGRRILLDLVPHTIYESLDANALARIIKDTRTVLITEYKTIIKMIDSESIKEEPNDEDWAAVFGAVNATSIVMRYGKGEISKQQIRTRIGGNRIETIQEENETAYMAIQEAKGVQGFGDELTAKMLAEYYARLV